METTEITITFTVIKGVDGEELRDKLKEVIFKEEVGDSGNMNWFDDNVIDIEYDEAE